MRVAYVPGYACSFIRADRPNCKTSQAVANAVHTKRLRARVDAFSNFASTCRLTWKVVSLVECYSNHMITRISIQTAGLAFGGTGLCSYRVRGVDGICA